MCQFIQAGRVGVGTLARYELASGPLGLGRWMACTNLPDTWSLPAVSQAVSRDAYCVFKAIRVIIFFAQTQSYPPATFQTKPPTSFARPATISTCGASGILAARVANVARHEGLELGRARRVASVVANRELGGLVARHEDLELGRARRDPARSNKTPRRRPPRGADATDAPAPQFRLRRSASWRPRGAGPAAPTRLMHRRRHGGPAAPMHPSHSLSPRRTRAPRSPARGASRRRASRATAGRRACGSLRWSECLRTSCEAIRGVALRFRECATSGRNENADETRARPEDRPPGRPPAERDG